MRKEKLPFLMWTLVVLLLAKTASSQFVCYKKTNCSQGDPNPLFTVKESFALCCGEPDIVSALSPDVDQTCTDCGPSSSERVSPRISALYPPQPLVLEVEATGYSDITWLLNGTATLFDFSRLTLENNNKKLTLSPTFTSDSGTYLAVIHTLEDGVKTLDFLVFPYDPPVITFPNPMEGDNLDYLVNISCTVMSNPIASVSIECPELQPFQTSIGVEEGEFGSASVVMVVTSIAKSNVTGLQMCFCVANIYDGQENVSINESINLLTYVPEVTFQNEDGTGREVNVISPLSISLQCTAKGRPMPQVTWYRNGTEIIPSNTISIQSNNDNSTTNSSLTISPTAFDDSGDYICSATNIYGNASGAITLNVQVSPYTVALVSELKINTNAEGEASLTCQSSGNPLPEILWLTKAGPLENCERTEELGGEAEIDLSIYFQNFSDFNSTTFLEDNEDSTAGVIDSCEVQTATSVSPAGLNTTISTLTIHNLYQEESLLVVCMADNGLPNINSTNEAAGIILLLDKSPYLVTHPTPIPLLIEGEKASFYCTAFSHLPVVVSWLKDGENITDLSSLAISNDTLLGFERFMYNSTLTLDSVSETDSGVYTCRMQNNEGTVEHSFEQTIQPSIFISTLPLVPVLEVSQGTNATISCNASGPSNLTIAWKVSGTFIVPNNGNFSTTTLDLNSDSSSVLSTLTIISVDLDDQANYSCIASNSFASMEEFVTILIVFVPPEISIDATNLIHVIGEGSTTVTCSANIYTPQIMDSIYLPSSVQEKYSFPMADVTFYGFTCDYNGLGEGSEDFPVVGGVMAECGLLLLQEASAGTYFGHITLTINIDEPGELLLNCSADNGISPVATTTVSLLVAAPLKINTASEQTVYVVNEDSYTTSCNASGSSNISIEWYHSNSTIPIAQGLESIISIEHGEDSALSTLLLTRVGLMEEGGYLCRATDLVTGYSVNKTILYILLAVPLEITIQPQFNVEFLLDGAMSVQLICNVSGEPTPIVTFAGLACGETESGGGMQVECFEEDVSNGVLISALLTISNYTTLGEHQLSCTADNGIENPVTQFVTLTVNSAPVINTQHRFEVVTAGDSLNISCNATGYPIPTVHFEKYPGSVLLGGQNFTDNDTFTVMSILAIDKVTPDDTGDYYCIAGNPHMVQTSKSILDVTVIFLPEVTVSASYIIHIPGESMTNVTCSAIALPVPDITFHNFMCMDGVIGEGEEDMSPVDGIEADCDQVTSLDNDLVVSITLLINKNQPGQFLLNCSAHNDVGMMAAEPVLLIVAEPIVITAGPVNTIELFGSNVTFSCQVKGYPPPNIIWIHENSSTNLTSQSTLVNGLSQLQLHSVSLLDEGVYTCIADNDVTSSMSSSAYLTVSGISPTLEVEFQNEMVIVSHTFDVNCTAKGIPLPTIEWFKDDTPIANSNDSVNVTATVQETIEGLMITISTLKIEAVGIKDAGYYTCLATNDFGAQEHNVANLVIHVPPVVTVSLAAASHVIGESPTQAVCSATSNPPPVVQFGYTGPCSYKENTSAIISAIPEISGVCESSSYLGLYTVTVTLTVGDINEVGEYQLNCTANTTVFPPATNQTTLSITVKPDVTVTASETLLAEGESLTLICNARGYPIPTITWLWNNKAISYTNVGNRRTIQLEPTESIYEARSNLTIINLIPGDSGEYRCRLDDTFLDNQLVTAEQEIIVQAKNDCLVNVSDSFHLTPCENGICQDELGGFTCLCFTNYTGTTCNETVNVLPKPEIVKPPPEVTETDLLENVSLTCLASGSPSYYWYKDGELLANSPVLTIAEVKPDDRGSYECVAINKVGNVTSDPSLVIIPGVYQYIVTFLVDTLSPNTTDIVNKIAICVAGRRLDAVSTQIYSASLCTADVCTNLPMYLDVIITVVKEPPNVDDTHGIIDALASKITSLQDECLPLMFTGKIRRFDGCAEETVQLNLELGINITWPESNLQEEVSMYCPCGDLTSSEFINKNASRYCNGSYALGGHWEEHNVTECQYNAQNINITLQLCYVTTVDDVVNQVNLLASATTEASVYSSFDLTVASILMERIAGSQEIKTNKAVQLDYMQSFDNLLDSSSEQIGESQEATGAAARILESLSVFEESVQIDEESDESLVMFQEDSVAVLLLETDVAQFTNQTFIVMIDEGVGTVTSLRLKKDFSLANSSHFEFSISIPQTLSSETFNLTDPLRVSYNIFTTSKLFQNDPNSIHGQSILDNNLTVGDIVISASLPIAGKVNRLVLNNVTIAFTKPEMVRANGTNSSHSTCVFWDIESSASTGEFDSWSDRGCTLVSDEDEDIIRCECSHLTSFGYLLAIEPKPKDDLALEVFLYVGCIVSIVCLMATLFTYLGSRTLRSTIKGKVILHTCLALIGLYVTFLVAHHSKSIREAEGIDGDILCAFIGALLYYFMLVYFLWTAVEAFDIHQKLVKIFVRPYKHYVLVSSIIAWGVPLVISCISVGAGYRDYLEYEFFCRPANYPFYVGFLVPFGMIYLFNVIVFVKVLVSLLSKRDKASKMHGSGGYTEMKKYCVIAFLLSINFGLGWIFGLLAIPQLPDTLYYAFLVLFSLFVGSQGVLVFILHCLRVKAARQTWKRWALIVLCCKSPIEARHYVKTAGLSSSLPFKLKKKKKKPDPHPTSSGHTKSLSFDPLQIDTDGGSTVPPEPSYDERMTMESFIQPPSFYENESESKLGLEGEKSDLSQPEFKARKKSRKVSSASGSQKKKKKKRSTSNRLSDQEFRVESMYSLGGLSTESQALEIHFKPETEESESEDEEEMWRKLQQQMQDIQADVKGNFKKEIDGII